MAEKTIHQFDAYCKRTLRNERIDYYRQKQYRMKHEVFLSDLEEGLFESNDSHKQDRSTQRRKEQESS